MKIAILGYGIEGQAAYDHWHEGNEITICDQNASIQLPDGVASQLGQDYLGGLDQFDLIVRSPNLHPRDIVAANGEAVLPKVTSNTNEFLKVCPTKNIIGVTGTKGKGTTSTLITKMLEADGHKVHLGGNIGIAPLELLKNSIQPDDWVILELSSYQLVDLHYSPTIALCLLLEPEHLDWHADLDEYIEAKSNLFRQQTTEDKAVYFSGNDYSVQIASAGNGQKIPYFSVPGALVKDNSVKIGDQAICQTSELKLPGRHNWQNVCAAVTVVWQITQNIEAMRSVLTTFAGLPYRIEFRAEKNGIRYYNDSFATGAPATIAAVEAVVEPKVLIVGGYDRMLPLENLAEFLKQQSSLRKVLVIGASSERLIRSLEAVGFDNFERSESKTMSEIVAQATALAQPGDAVLLSPAFASFDMFKNFEERGRMFNEAVETL